MKLNKKNKIVAIVLFIIMTITAVLSLIFSFYPYLFFKSAPQIVLHILTVINFLIPIAGITVMLFFIYRREHS